MVNYQYSACTVLRILLEGIKTNTEVSRANPNTSSPTVGSINRISSSSGSHLRRFKFCSWFFCWLYGEDSWSSSPIQKSESVPGFFVKKLGGDNESVRSSFVFQLEICMPELGPLCLNRFFLQLEHWPCTLRAKIVFCRASTFCNSSELGNKPWKKE